MSKKKDLSQPGQFQYNERVTLIGPKGVLKGVAILGPARDKTQVEISKTDAIALGINPPVRESGDLDGSEKIYIATEKTVIEANESVIIAKRHIHMTQEDAKRLGVKDKQLVRVRINSDRPVVLEDVVVRVNSRYRLSMHIDFDEANGAGYEDGTLGEMII
jgi:putative phosphotransacetylase